MSRKEGLSVSEKQETSSKEMGAQALRWTDVGVTRDEEEQRNLNSMEGEPVRSGRNHPSAPGAQSAPGPSQSQYTRLYLSVTPQAQP